MSTTLPADMDMVAFLPLLREWVEDPVVVRELIYSKWPLIGLVEKDTEAGGEDIAIPTVLAGSGMSSPQYSVAYNNQNGGKQARFQVPLSDFFRLGSIDNKTWRLSKNSKQAYRNSLEVMASATMKEIAKDWAWCAHRAGTGTMGVISSISAGGIIKLTNPTDAMIFNPGDILMAYTGDGTGTALPAFGYVVGADPTSTTANLTVSPNPPVNGVLGAPGLPASWSASTNPYLVKQGSFNNDPKGWAYWHPVGTATLAIPNGGVRAVGGTPQTTYGVDVSQFPQKLQGTMVPLGNTPSIEEQLINLVTATTLFSGAPDCILVHPNSYAALEKAMTGRRQYQWLEGAHEGVGFDGIRISAGGSNPIVIADPAAIPRTAQAIQLDTARIYSAGAFPTKLTRPSGAEMIDIQNADMTQMSFGGHVAMADNGTMYNGTAQLSA